MKLPILIWPNGRLHEISQPVDNPKDPGIQAVCQDMQDTLEAAGNGVGLAAIQIGASSRIYMSLIKGEARFYINPKITAFTGKPTPIMEGCLSVPGIFEVVDRYPEVTIEASDRTGFRFVTELKGLEAQIAQHEVEHLDGKVFVQKLSMTKRDQIRKQMKKASRVK